MKLTKCDKIRLLAHSIIMLESGYMNKHEPIIKLAREIAYLENGNPNFAELSGHALLPDEVHNAIKEEVKKDFNIDLGEYKPF